MNIPDTPQYSMNRPRNDRTKTQDTSSEMMSLRLHTILFNTMPIRTTTQPVNHQGHLHNRPENRLDASICILSGLQDLYKTMLRLDFHKAIYHLAIRNG